MSNLPRLLEFLREQWARVPEYVLDGHSPGDPQGHAYTALAATAGITCPTELVVLGDELARMRVWIGSWEFFDAASAVSERKMLVSLSTRSPCLKPRAEMLPLFVRDGDLLLLGRDGAIWLFTHDGFEYDCGPVAASVDELFGRLLDGPEIPQGQASPLGFVWVDDIEYRYAVSHVHPDGRCTTMLYVALPFDRQRAGVTAVFPDPMPPTVRRRRVGLVDTGKGVVDLSAPKTIATIVRLARNQGWTGEGEPLDLGDGSPLLDGG